MREQLLVSDSAAILCNLFRKKSAATATVCSYCYTIVAVQLQLKPAFHPTATVTSFQFDVEAVFLNIDCASLLKCAFKICLCFFCEDSQIVIVIEKGKGSGEVIACRRW